MGVGLGRKGAGFSGSAEQPRVLGKGPGLGAVWVDRKEGASELGLEDV